MYKQDEEGLRRVCTKNTPSRIQVRGWRPFQITEELTEKDTASGETSSAGSGGRQTWRGPDAREGLHKEVMEGEPATSFPPQLRLGQSRTGNCRGRETTFLGGKGSPDVVSKIKRSLGGRTALTCCALNGSLSKQWAPSSVVILPIFVVGKILSMVKVILYLGKYKYICKIK